MVAPIDDIILEILDVFLRDIKTICMRMYTLQYGRHTPLSPSDQAFREIRQWSNSCARLCKAVI